MITPTSLRRLAVAYSAALVAVFASSVFALNPAVPPSGNFDLSHWKLTLPTGSAGDPDEILPAQLNNGYTNSPYFFTSTSDGAMRFWAPVTGVTTSGSSYPRCELREQISPGNDTPNWFADGTHILDGQVRIRQVPSTGKLIIGQIHGKFAPGGADANPLVKLAYDQSSSAVRIQVKTSPHKSDSSESVDVVSGIAVGDLITYQIKVIDGVVYNTVNGTTHARDFYATDPDWAGTDLYFKAGSYCQDNSGTSSEGAKVDFYALAITHGTPAPPTITTTSLPSGRTTISYGNQQLSATGGTTPYTWSLSAGTLPAGLSLNASTGIISGTPTTAGTSSFTARVTDAASQIDTQALSITITTNSVPNITTTSLPGASTGVAYSQSIASTGGDGVLVWSVSAGTLPAGLSLTGVNLQNATISGTPTGSGTSNFTLRLADVDADADTQPLSIVVTAPPSDPEIVPVSSPDSTPWDTAGLNGPPNLWDGATVDGTNDSRWASNASPGTLASAPRYVVLDLGASYNLTKFVLHPYQSRAYHYELYVSNSATSWGTAVVNVQQSTGAPNYTHVLGAAATGRYVKLVVDGITGTSTTWASINELDLFGTAAGNTAPTVSNIADQSTTAGVATGPISFTITDENPAAVTLSGSSSNTTLVPNGNVAFGGAGSNRTVTVTPAAGQTGSATITVTANDGALTGTDTFVLTVTPGGTGAFIMSANQVVMEAENASSRTSGGGKSWTNITQSGASGAASNNAIQALTNSGVTASAPGTSTCRADYQISVPAGSAANFHVHVRGRGPSTSDDSIFISVNGSTSTYQQLVTTSALGWKASTSTIALPAGTQTLTLWMREDGTILDKIVVSSSSTLPTGTGPAESPRN